MSARVATSGREADGSGMPANSVERASSISLDEWAVLVLCLLALALRLAFVAGPSLRGDEALSVIYGQQSLPEIVRISRYVSGHPPLFYSLLHFWVRAAGSTELAARFFAVWWGVLLTPLAYALGRTLFGRRTGAWAAALLAIHPFHIWHAQDIRSYSMLAALGLLSCWAFWRAFKRASWKSWALYAASGIAVVHCHYFGSFLILPQGICWFVATAFAARKETRFFDPTEGWRNPVSLRGVMPAALAFAAIVGCLVPWLWLARTVLAGGHGPGGSSASLGALLSRSLITFGTGYWRETWGRGLLAAGLVLLVGWGVWAAFRRNAQAAWFLTLVIGVPFVCLFVLSRTRPLYRERYLVYSAPALSLLIGMGMAVLVDRGGGKDLRAPVLRWAGRAALAVSLLFLAGANGYALRQHYISPAYAKSPQWREAAAFLRQRLGPGDVVILNHQDQAFLYYYDDPDLLVLPTPEARDEASVRSSLEDLAARYDRVWLLPDTARLWDQEGMVRKWLAQNCELVLESHWRGVLLLRYHTARYLEEEYAPLDVRMGESIRLVGYALRDEEGRVVDRAEVARGGRVRLTLYWLSEAPIKREYVVFTHLLDGTGWLRGQQDNQPRQGTYPTRAWVPGRWVIDIYRIPVAADAPPGEALLEVGMYDPSTGERLEVRGADADVDQRRVVLDGVVRIPE